MKFIKYHGRQVMFNDGRIITLDNFEDRYKEKNNSGYYYYNNGSNRIDLHMAYSSKQLKEDEGFWKLLPEETEITYEIY